MLLSFTARRNGVWLDILDCFMFVGNIKDEQIQMPSFGLTVGGKPSPLGVRPQFERWIWYTWCFRCTRNQGPWGFISDLRSHIGIHSGIEMKKEPSKVWALAFSG